MTSKRLLDLAAKVLLDAADYIEKHGHHKGNYYAYTGWWGKRNPPACMFGAMRKITGDENNELLSLSDVINAAIARLPDHIRNDVVAWNDAPERTAEEVIAVLRQAAIS